MDEVVKEIEEDLLKQSSGYKAKIMLNISIAEQCSGSEKYCSAGLTLEIIIK